MTGSTIIDLNNKYRTLLTDVLPYEMPIAISNHHFYKDMLNEDLRDRFQKILGIKDISSTECIPFRYNVRRAGGMKSRSLCVMHPVSQLSVVDFYKKYGSYMLYLCNLSPFSIRHINAIAECRFHEKEMKDKPEGDQEIAPELADTWEPRFRSYFNYRDYNLVYKYFDDFLFIRDEQKFRYMRTIDVSKCFYHIYTHSVAWAIKGKESAKASKHKDTFEKHFDQLMQKMNYGETNGIIVGPEVSRIFAEIIFQRIDLNLLQKLRDDGLELHKDFQIRRYVDDFYIYANSISELDKIECALKDELEPYRLFVNEKKTETYNRPFVSVQTMGKRAIIKLKREYTEVSDPKNPYPKLKGNAFKRFVQDYRQAVKASGASFDMVNRYALSLIKTFIIGSLSEKWQSSEINLSPDILCNVLEISFYCFCQDMNASASYKISRIITAIHKMSNTDIAHKERIEQIIRRESKRCLDISLQTNFNDTVDLETINLLLTLDATVGVPYDSDYILSLFGIKQEEDCLKLSYFHICVLLQVAKRIPQYFIIKEWVLKTAKNRFASLENDWKKFAELSMLFFDLQSCPYLNPQEKDELLKAAKVKKGNEGWMRKNIWFMDWNYCNNLMNYLKKKEFHFAYE